MSSTTPHHSPSHLDDPDLLGGDETPKVTRGTVVFDDSRFCMNLLSSFDEGNGLNLIKDADYTSSSSSSGIVSSSTAGKEYLEDAGSYLGDWSNNDKKVTASGTDCLAYRRPWATPPTAISESTKLQIGGCTQQIMLIGLDFITYIMGVFTNHFEQPSIFDLNKHSRYVILNIIWMY